MALLLHHRRIKIWIRDEKYAVIQQTHNNIFSASVTVNISLVAQSSGLYGYFTEKYTQTGMNEAFGSNDKANTTTQKSMGAAAMIRGC